MSEAISEYQIRQTAEMIIELAHRSQAVEKVLDTVIKKSDPAASMSPGSLKEHVDTILKLWFKQFGGSLEFIDRVQVAAHKIIDDSN